LGHAFSWRFIPSICGPYHTILLEPEHRYSEWGAIRLWAKQRKLLKVAEMGTVSVGSVLFLPVAVPLLLGAGRRSTTFVEGEEYRGNHRDQLWVYVNGVSVTRSLQRMNGKQLALAFQREITCFHNPTQGMAFDLFECMMGRTLNKIGKVAHKLSAYLHQTLTENPNKKVVLIAHSQGTIITSNAIEYLIHANECTGLERLEVFTFGCAATEFFQVRDKLTGDLVPFYEHYGNHSDFVAQIGALRDRSEYPFPGAIFTRMKEGHLLGEHYLPGVVEREYQCSTGSTIVQSRLYSYLAASAGDSHSC